MSKNKKIGITIQEFDFLRAYIDIASPSFGNAFQSAIKAGYSPSYCRVIRRHYQPWRLRWLKHAIKNEDLVRVIETIRGIDLGPPIPSERKMKQIMRQHEREVCDGMTAKEVFAALDALIGKSI